MNTHGRVWNDMLDSALHHHHHPPDERISFGFTSSAGGCDVPFNSEVRGESVEVSVVDGCVVHLTFIQEICDLSQIRN